MQKLSREEIYTVAFEQNPVLSMHFNCYCYVNHSKTQRFQQHRLSFTVTKDGFYKWWISLCTLKDHQWQRQRHVISHVPVIMVFHYIQVKDSKGKMDGFVEGEETCIMFINHSTCNISSKNIAVYLFIIVIFTKSPFFCCSLDGQANFPYSVQRRHILPTQQENH